jgi:hypothetical protein
MSIYVKLFLTHAQTQNIKIENGNGYLEEHYE